MLTFREFQIANKIVSAQSGIHIKELAAEFQVSLRTIQYDLRNVKDFISTQGIFFFSSRGKGIWIEGSESQKETALEELSHMQMDSIYFNQDMRMQRILLQLLLSEGYITANTLAEKLNVSRGTILACRFALCHLHIFANYYLLFFKHIPHVSSPMALYFLPYLRFAFSKFLALFELEKAVTRSQPFPHINRI